MPESTARRRFQRARSDAEKAERREAILTAADALLRSTGFEGFSMSLLARKAGVAKGTLYLYFETREQVLLALYVEALDAWGRTLLAGLGEGMGDEAFVTLFQSAAAEDPNFLTLRARLESVIEHNVSRESLIEAKRAMRSLIGDVAPRVEATLALPAGAGQRLLVALGALHLGTEHSRLGPAVTGLALPDDVSAFVQAHRDTDLFREVAPMVVAGFRRPGATRDADGPSRG